MNCKIDDMAYIKKALRQENIGLVVRCKAYLGYYSRGEIITLNGENWIAFDTDDYWLIENNYSNIETQYGLSKESYIMDSWLEPIPPIIKGSKIATEIKINENIDA